MWVIFFMIIAIFLTVATFVINAIEQGFPSENKKMKMGQKALGMRGSWEEPGDEELVAVIAAALAAYLGRKPEELLLRSVRPIEKEVNPWVQAGRMGLMEKRAIQCGLREGAKNSIVEGDLLHAFERGDVHEKVQGYGKRKDL